MLLNYCIGLLRHGRIGDGYAPHQARREGEGESFPGPRDVSGARRQSKILKMVFQVASF